MTGYCVSDIAAITGGVLSGDGAALVTGVVIDSRAVTPGALFAAIPGERVDGHDYIGKAFDLGAACCLAQRVPAGETRPVICVPDTAAALETLARAYRARFSIPVLGDEGSTCTIIAGTRRIPVRISAYGQHMVYAALEGAAVGIEYGLTDDEIIRGIAAYQPVGSRARVVRTARYTVIDDCYNANPDSTAAALRSMATLPAGRRVAVLGNMGELGTNAAALHRETGVCAAKAGVSLVITCGELARQIAAGAAAEDPAVATASFDTLDALLPALPGLLQPGDCVLVKASHSMQFERIVQALTQA